MRTSALAVALVALAGHASADSLVDGTVRAPDVEVAAKVKLDIPAIPAFELPTANPDGSHSVKELRVRGKRLLDTDLTIKGFVTWAYDCPTAVRTSGETDKAVKQRIEDDPTICERAKFYVGDRKDTSPDKSLWIVDVPRSYNKLEIQRIRKPDRNAPDRCEPNEKDPKKQVCPSYKPGDQVEITGTWRLTSAHGERNSDGLLVYKRMKNVTRRWETPGPRPAASPPPATPPTTGSPPTVMAASTAKPPTRKVARSIYDDSVQIAGEATKAYGQKQWDTAVERFSKAVDRWPENHAAWYGLAAAHAQRARWAQAADAAAKAVQLQPDVPMYQLAYGRYLYEKAILTAKEDQAKRENKKVEEVDPDLSTINFEKASAHLAAALQLNGDLWRAHYLIGSIARAGGRPKDAAAAFSKSVKLGAWETAPWIALAELYRAWDYHDETIKVAEQGTLVIAVDAEKSDLWLEIGIAYDDKRQDDKAIAAFDKALAARPGNVLAKFARGQAYFRKGDHARAKRDLEEIAKASLPDFFKQQASTMLMDIAAKRK